MSEPVTADHLAHEREVCDAAHLASAAMKLLGEGDLSDETCAETIAAFANHLARPISYAVLAERREVLGELAPSVWEFGGWCHANDAPLSGSTAWLLAALLEAHALGGV